MTFFRIVTHIVAMLYRYSDVEIFTTPYHLLNLRQFINDNKAFFVILARTKEDVSSAVQFASKHNLALSVFSTGHEFQDRNGALAPNGLLIRTTCLRTVEIDLDPNNRFGHPDGVCTTSDGFGLYPKIGFWKIHREIG